jgi:hypothetical protein
VWRGDDGKSVLRAWRGNKRCTKHSSNVHGAGRKGARAHTATWPYGSHQGWDIGQNYTGHLQQKHVNRNKQLLDKVIHTVLKGTEEGWQ